MKLDPDALRVALAEVEHAIDKPNATLNVNDESDFVRFYHFDQLIRAGYIRALDASSHGGGQYIVQDLTMPGHELLNKMRSDTVWDRTKGKVAELGGTVPIRVLEKLLDSSWDAVLGALG